MGRLSADDLTHSRAFTTAVNASKRPTAEQKDETKAVRHFNTSRTLKAVNDSSTIDFAYFPDFDPDNAEASALRVPLLHNNFSPARTGAHSLEAADSVCELSIVDLESSTNACTGGHESRDQHHDT
jgi:hypothetical protein